MPESCRGRKCPRQNIAVNSLKLGETLFRNKDTCVINVRMDAVLQKVASTAGGAAMNTIPSKERRRTIRFKGRKEAILIHPNGINHIGDISFGGLCFHCSQEEFFPEHWPVEIVYAGTPLYITGLSVRLVDEQLDEIMNFLAVPTKKIGVEFVAMNDRNQALLTTLFGYLDEGKAN